MGSWRHRVIGLVAIAALGGTPLMAAICAGLCAPGRGHHATPAQTRPAAAAACHEAPGPGARLGALHAGDCVSHDGPSVDLATARATGRDDGWAVRAPLAASSTDAGLSDLRARGLPARGWLPIPRPRPHPPAALRI